MRVADDGATEVVAMATGADLTLGVAGTTTWLEDCALRRDDGEFADNAASDKPTVREWAALEDALRAVERVAGVPSVAMSRWVRGVLGAGGEAAADWLLLRALTGLGVDEGPTFRGMALK